MIRILNSINTYWLIISLIFLALISLLSLWPLDALPPFPGNDKTHHLIAYTALMFPAALHRPRYILALGVFFILFGGAIELLQPFVNRYAEWLDFFVNALGVMLGWVLGRMAGSLIYSYGCATD